jgi:protein kinase domain-containing protein
VDDVGFDERKCRNDDDCVEAFSKQENRTNLRVPCSAAGRCDGLNELKNIANAGRQFVSFLLAPGSPGMLRPLVDEIVDGYGDGRSRTDRMLRLFDRLVGSYASGQYLGTDRRTDRPRSSAYVELPSSDLPGLYDYRCRYSIASAGCTVSVFDRAEAEHLCDFDPLCRAFVLSNQTSWTGRRYAHLKSNVSTPTANAGTTLYVRPFRVA